MNEQREISS